MKEGVKLLGFLVIIYSIVFGFASAIGPAGPGDVTLLGVLVGWLPIGLFISGIGIMRLKKWSQYTTIAIMFYFTVHNLYSWLIKYYDGDVVNFLRGMHVFFIVPLIVMVSLLIPKVKEQFK